MAGIKGRLLALSWTMPPLVFPRSLQISRLLRALKARGWDTTVVTVTPESEPFAAVDRDLEGFYRDAYRRILVELREEEKPSPLWLKVWRRVDAPADQKVDNWIRRATPVMREEIASGNYDAMVTFAQPWVDHTIGLSLKRAFPDFPWVAHFSDPWVDSPYSKFSSQMERDATAHQERQVIAAADAVGFVNRHTANLVMNKYPKEWQEKVHVIPHGFEVDLLSLVRLPSPRAATMRLVHTGNFYGHRKPDLVLRAVKELSDQLGSKSSLRLEFVGHADNALRQMASQIGVDDIVTFTGSKSYLDSLEEARSADLLLLIDAPADTSVFLPSKIVDYFMLQRPILGITPMHGASAEALRAGGCPVVDPEDYEGILGALTEALRRWETGSLSGLIPSLSSAKEFEIERVAGQFEAALLSAAPKLMKALTINQPRFLSLEGVSMILDRRRSRDPITLVLWNSDEALAEALLAQPDVASIITTSENPELANRYPSRVGWWNTDSAELRPPNRLGAEIHYFVPGGQWRFGVRTTYRLWQRNVRRVILHDADLGTVHTTIVALLVSAGASSLDDRFSRTSIGRRLDPWIPWHSANTISRHLARRFTPSRAVPGRTMLVTGSLGPGGSERQTLNTLVGLKAAGVADLSLVHVHPMVAPNDFFYPPLRDAGIACLHLEEEALQERPANELPPNYRTLLQAMGRLGMRRDIVLSYLRLFSRWQPEVVHTWLDDTNVTAGMAAVLAGVPKVILSCRSLAPYHFPFHQSYMRPIYKIMAEQPGVTILNNSKSGAEDYSRWLGGVSGIHVIRNGFDFSEARIDYLDASRHLRMIAGAPENALLVGTIMRLSAEKQPHLWVDIAEQVGRSRPNTHYVMIGDGPLMGELSSRIESSSMKGRISLLGRRKNVAQLLAGLDVFVLTSSVEGLPNVVVEAQAEGVPVVASDVGGVGEIFEDGSTGLLVRRQTVGDFAQAVLQVLDDTALRQRARDLAPSLMRQRFSVDRMIKETLLAYGRVN